MQLLLLVSVLVLLCSTLGVAAADSNAADDSAAAAAADAQATPAAPAKEAPQHSVPPPPLTPERMQVLLAHGVVPDVVPSARVPTSLLKLSFGADALRVAELGLRVSPGQVLERPRLNYNVHANKFYTVAMVDPDAPSRARPVNAQWLHWLVVNIPGRDAMRGDILVEYAPPTPPEGTGTHRYVFLVLEQGKHWDVASAPHITRTTTSGRAKWSWERFLQQMNDPLAKLQAINFLLAEYDESVPQIQSQMTD